MIPRDEFTPHGYLDNPNHFWKLNPSGVLRSLEPLGMGWHVPNLGSYVYNQFQYTAHLTIGLNINGMVLVTPEDFRRHKCTITSQLHTKNRFAYSCVIPQYELTLTVEYFLVGEQALGCVVHISTTFAAPIPVTCYLIHLHTHNPYTSRLWEHGLYALQNREEGYGLLGLASEGDVFVHGGRVVGDIVCSWEKMGFALTLDDIAAWAAGARVPRPAVTQREADTGWQVRALAVPCKFTIGGTTPSMTMHTALARGVSQDQALSYWRQAVDALLEAEDKHRADDEKFWQQAPQLSGDWPAHWRRGLIYDLETLRMTIRQPAGMIDSPWDGMQVQAPRTVLAEAAMDALFLSYADPELAEEVLLGHFMSSPRPNLPCMREDGSYNMVADDGQICGTAPEWGFPLWCCDQLFRRTGNLNWLCRLYPKAAAYLRWWLEHRRDAEGWLVYACSWESGQDVSSRFGPQQTGGTIIQHVRPVDLQASMVQSAAILVYWANLLRESNMPAQDEVDYVAESAFWQAVANEFTVKTRLMWRDGWFRDYDSVAAEWSIQQDAMHLAPVFCGAAGWGHVEQLRPFLAQPPLHSNGWAPLSWPPVVMTLVGAASAGQMPLEAVELAYRYIDGSYRSTDSRQLDEDGGLPGVTREYRKTVQVGKWGEIAYANAGIEGYGWGALSIHLLLRYLLGLREVEAEKILVAPALPQALRHSGATYRIEPLPWGRYLLRVECQVRGATGYAMYLQCITRDEAKGLDRQSWFTGERACSWEGTWGEARTLLLADMTVISAS